MTNTIRKPDRHGEQRSIISAVRNLLYGAVFPTIVLGLLLLKRPAALTRTGSKVLGYRSWSSITWLTILLLVLVAMWFLVVRLLRS